MRNRDNHPKFNSIKVATYPRLSELYDFETTTNILKILNISDDCERNIRVINNFSVKLVEYIMVHYCNPDPISSCARGTIINLNTMQIVCRSFPFTPEYNIGNNSYKFEVNRILKNLKDYRIVISYEGTILRLWYMKEKEDWMISTHTKIDGKKCKWSGDEFGDMFDKLWNKEDYKLLDKNKTYAFLLSHKGGKNMFNNNNSLLYLGCASKMPGGEYSTINNFDKIEFKTEKVFFQSELDISEKEIGDILNSEEKNAALLFQHKVNGKCVKLVNSYRSKKSFGATNLNERFVHSLLEGNADSTNELRKLASPEEVNAFNKIEAQIGAIPKVMYTWYNYRYVQKKFLQLNQSAHNIVKSSKDFIENSTISAGEEKFMLDVFKNVMKDRPGDTYRTLIDYESVINENIK
ncbi:MAG TPA: hypothetical protein VLE02_01060 [Nitrosarchaeum sp.]|nr:hypothetical protein [Nitrosarchaeum sp.]